MMKSASSVKTAWHTLYSQLLSHCCAKRSSRMLCSTIVRCAMYLIQTYCLPSLLYSCETWSLSPCDEKRVDVAWNNAFQKIFNAYWHESVKPL